MTATTTKSTLKIDGNGASGRFYPTRNDLSTTVRQQIATLLNDTLATAIDLKTQTKQAHWNVKGLEFYQLHELFDEIATEIEEFVDLVAERITALGGTALGTARLAVERTSLPEYPLDIVDGVEHLEALAERFAIFAQQVRSGSDEAARLGDADTADLYTEISRTVDKRLWFLEAHLINKSDLK